MWQKDEAKREVDYFVLSDLDDNYILSLLKWAIKHHIKNEFV